MLHAIPCLHRITATPLTLTELRQVRDENQTLRSGDSIIDKRTGEIIGCYIRTKFLHKPYCYPHQAGKKTARRPSFVMLDDGTPIDIGGAPETANQSSAEIIQFPAQDHSPKSNAGRPPPVLNNPLAEPLQYCKVLKAPTTWMDNYVIGACGIQVERENGAIATTGRFNVSPSDVRMVLHQPTISTETAATVLCNHNLEPMNVRQVERVVQAARIALGGMMRHLERHPSLLEQFDYTLDFEAFWRERSGHLRGVSLEKAEAIKLFQQDQNVTITDVVNRFRVHRNTVSKWRQEALMHN